MVEDAQNSHQQHVEKRCCPELSWRQAQLGGYTQACFSSEMTSEPEQEPPGPVISLPAAELRQ